MIHNTRLDELAAMEAAATDGPWTLRQRPCELGCCDDIREVLAQYPDDESPMRELATVHGGNAVWLNEREPAANAAFIAAARNEFAAMIEQCRKANQLQASWDSFIGMLGALSEGKREDRDMSSADAFIRAWEKQNAEVNRLRDLLIEVSRLRTPHLPTPLLHRIDTALKGPTQ